jgi:hypothetical protein
MSGRARTIFTASIALAGLAATAGHAAAQGPSVRIDHAAARVVVVVENRADISVSVTRGDPRLPAVTVRRDGGVTVVDGGLNTWGMNCGGGYSVNHLWGGISHTRDDRSVRLPGRGKIDLTALPVITVHVPRRAAISESGAVWGEVGASEALDLSMSGCGDWSIGPVAGRASLSMSGSGDVRGAGVGALKVSTSGSGSVELTGVSGAAEVSVSGSSDIKLGVVGGALMAHSAGSGNLTAASVAGPIESSIAGSSDVKILGGRSPKVAVQIAGSGDFEFNGVAGALSASVAGSGNVRVARVDGPVSKSVMGSGEVQVGR